MDDSPVKKRLNVELGDIIQVEAPSDQEVHNVKYLVKYLDTRQMVLLTENNDETTLFINEDGSPRNEAITGITILSRADKPGYATQNDLVPQTWVDIYFGGDIPVVITGKITDLEEDRIELTTHPDNDVIYIDFAYKGIPEDIPIEKILIRGQPGETKKTPEPDAELLIPVEEDDSPMDDEMSVPVAEIKEQIRELILDADQLQFGVELDAVTQVVDVPESEQRFGIEKQTNDLLDELLSTIPNAQRTESVLNSIHTMIGRFKQLRTAYSKFDEQGNALMPNVQGAGFKPLVETLENFNQKLYWILPVAKNKKKVYDTDADVQDEYSDIDPLTLAETRIAEDRVEDTYLGNNVPDDENNYAYLIRSMRPFLTPFTPPDYAEFNIVTKAVEANMTAVVDNLEDLYSSVAKNDDIKRRRFVVQEYNLGQTVLEAAKIRGGDVIVKRKPLTPNDSLTLKSLLTLPESTVRFSHINLPATDIMTKANLNLHFLNYWQLLKQNTEVSKVIVDDLAVKIDYDKESFLAGITEFLLDESIEDADKYHKYLEAVVPKTRVLFELVKSHIVGKLSVYDVVSYLEPFMVYQKDLSFKQYQEITDFIRGRIKEYKINYIAKTRELSQLKANDPAKNNQPALSKLLDSEPTTSERVHMEYKFDKLPRDNMSDAEMMYIMNGIDFARLYNTAIANMGTDLMIPDGLDKLTNIDEHVKNTEREAKEADDECNKFVLSKRYIAMDELEEDNGKDIYFDKQYDKTFYDMLKDNETFEETELPVKERTRLLAEKLRENIGLNDADSMRDAEAMIAGKRKVVDGDYAVLQMDDGEKVEMLYFKRYDGSWERDNTISEDIFTDKSKTFCNLSERCLQVKDSCDDIDAAAAQIKGENLKKLLNEFDTDLAESKAATTQKIKTALDEAFSRVGALIALEKTKYLAYDDKKYNIGTTAEEVVEPTSPHMGLRDLILGQADFAKRQLDIVKFSVQYTRPATENEDRWWLYCISTNSKLLPTFISELASVFTQRDNYLDAVHQVCAQQGTISDDGEAWVDKHSGYTIVNIDFDTDEGFTEDGFRSKSRDMLEADLGNSVLQGTKTKQEFESPEARRISNIVSSMSGFMGINPKPYIEFVVRSTIKLQGSKMPSKEAYERAVAAAEARGKKNIDPYEKKYNSSLIIIALSYLLIAIQTAIPSIRTRKTHPGCIKSFVGFPMGGSEDKSGLTYVACVAHKIKSSIEPWSAIKRLSSTGISKQMEETITKFIMQSSEILEKIKEKQTYLTISKDEEIPLEHDIQNWINFLPPLRPVKVNVQNVSGEFKQAFIESIKKGTKQQHEMMNVFRSKIIYFSLAIEEAIQKVVKKKTAILTNNNAEPFLENSCCDDGVTNALAYFTALEPDIVTYNNSVVQLQDLLDDAGIMAQAGLFFDPTDTKRKFPELSDEFSEETIYQAFIVYCKYNSDIPVSEELRAVCMDKPDDFDIKDSIDEKIRKLKRDGKNFSNQSLDQLLAVINKSNLVELKMHTAAVNNVQVLRDIIGSMDDRDVQNVPAAFRNKFGAMIDTFEIGGLKQDTPEMREFKNYLAAANEEMQNKIVGFVRTSTNMNERKFAQFEKCIRDISVFKETGNDLYIERQDETIYKMTQFIKNSLRSITRVFPNIIINDNTVSMTIPKHWKLSERHVSDLQAILQKHYSPLHKYFKDPVISLMLEKVQLLTRDVDMLAQNTEFYAPIKVGEEVKYSVFDRRLSIMLFKFYFYTVLLDFISLKDDDDLLIRAVPRPVGEAFSEDTITSVEVREMETGDISELEIVSGEKELLTEKIAGLLVAFSTIICSDKDVIDYNYDSLMERVLRAKEKEKDIMTDYLKEMTDEEREIENLFKNHKLEKWSKGLQKGLTTYQKDTYDEERDAMEAQTLREMQLGESNLVTDMNRSIYSMDLLQEQADAEDIDREAFDMNNMANDDDYGDNDGDEEY